jgi:organic radical activating enzyme
MQKHIKILDIFYGNKCNLACNQCDTHSDVIRTSEYDTTIDTIKESILLANEKFDVENWSVLGGEPLLYKDTVLEIIKFLRSIEPNKTIFFPTNGLLLDKNIDFVVELIQKYKVWVQVCNHTVKFKDTTLTDKIIKATHAIAEKTGIPKLTPSYLWWNSIMKLSSGTDNWKAYIKAKGIDPSKDDVVEETWIKENYGIYYMEANSFQSLHRYINGKPKPFTDNDPKSSYWNSCPSVFCAFLYDKKIYKCAALGSLRNFLQTKDVVDDADWAPYLNYKPVNLVSGSDTEMQHFADTHYCHIDECAMCPSKEISIIKTEENVLPIHFKR